MKVKILKHNRTNAPFAFISGAMSFFWRDTQLPEVGSEVDVMIKKVIFTKNERGFYTRTPRHFLIELITNKHQLVEIDGFECAGSMCCTTARIKGGGIVTPGLLNGVIKTANNVNVGWNGQERQPLMPCSIYIEKDALDSSTCKSLRCEGVPDLSHLNLDR